MNLPAKSSDDPGMAAEGVVGHAGATGEGSGAVRNPWKDHTGPASAEDGLRRGLAAASGRPFVAIVGIDRFRGVMDELSKQEADAAIAMLCRRIRACPASARLGRLNRSSIEFAFFAPSFEAAERTLVALQQDLEAPIALDERHLTLDIAIGFAGRETAREDLEALVDRAEHALAKARARHEKVGAFTEQDRIERTARLSLVRDLRSAIANQELTVVYQPKLCLRSLRVKAMEVLIRWPHLQRGLVPPDTFIPLAEDHGEIAALTERVLRIAIADAEALARDGHEVRIDLNISGGLLADPAFAASLLAALKGREARFGLEITETAVIANPEAALKHIGAFSAAGLAIAIDDYGSGLSSLTYLKQIPADELKIDKSFVMGLTTSHRDPLLVRSTIDLAHALGMTVTAEGVENPMALALLKAMGCDAVQGYQVSKPLAFSAAVRFLEQFSYSDVAPTIRVAS